MKILSGKASLLFKLITVLATSIAVVGIMCIPGFAASVNATEIELYELNDWAKEHISIPEGSNTFQINVTGSTDVFYYVAEGDSVTVSDTGLIEVAHTTYYWNGNYGSTVPSGAEGERIEIETNFGKSIVRVIVGNETFDIKVTVTDYAITYAHKVIDEYLSENITPDMSEYEKLDVICQFVAGHDYSGYYSSGAAMIITGGGDCWASVDVVLAMCEKAGIEAWGRNASKDPGAGSGHRNVMAICDGKYYVVDAGYTGTAPRYYSIFERTSLFSTNVIDYENKKIEIYQYDGTSDVTSLAIPETIDGYTVTSIGKSAFSGLDSLETITFPDTLERIGDYAFFNFWSSLTTLEIPKNVKEIGNNPFSYCTKLNLTVNKDNPYFTIDNDILYTADKKELICANITGEEFVIQDTVTTIRPYAFRGNEIVIAVTIPSTVTSIGEGAFGECFNLKNVTIKGNGLLTIEDFAFYRAYSLSEITIPESVTSIGEYAFNDCAEDFKIRCYSGSIAEKYATDNDFKYKLLGVPPAVISDLKLGGRANNALRLNWAKNDTADGYIIEQYKDGKWVRIAKITNPATTTYRVTGLAAGTAYKFRMKAYVTDGTDALYSGYTSTLAARTNPSKVSGLKLGGRAADALRLNWTKNTSADGYIIEQYKSGKWVRIAKITSNATTTYRVTGLKASTQYKFRIKAYKMSGKTALYSGYTKTLSAYTNPSKVANLKITGKASNALRLGWAKNTTADGYIIEMYKGGKWVRAAKITSNETLTFRKSGLAKGTTYKFRVRTYNMVGKTALYGNYVNVSGTTNK